jgi:hypothetical protein
MAEDKRERAVEARAEPAPSSVVRPPCEAMRILITNDDGNVWVIAPEFDQSGVSPRP